MTFDATGLLIFLLAIVPGFVAQQSRHSIVPRSVLPRTVLEETGDYVLNSVFIHVFLLVVFRLLLSLANPSLVATLASSIEQKKLLYWAWQHRYLVLVYYLVSLITGILVGFLRGTLSLNQPVRNWLINSAWVGQFLFKLGIMSFLQEEPVWYGVLREQSSGERTFVQVKMKGNGGFYTGELKYFAILPDSETEKDFYLVNACYSRSDQDEYAPVKADGILLNSGDTESIEVIKRLYP
jgi:hypothetical protein